MCAADEGCTKIAELLLANGAKVKIKDNFGNTALKHAKESAADDIVYLLETMKK